MRLNRSAGSSDRNVAREERLRAYDRARVRLARERRRPLWVLGLLAGPGLLVMLGENDGPSMLSYATTGASYGVGFFVPFILVTFLMAYVIQEMVVRIGIATQRGHAELIYERFGPLWGRFALGDLFVGNILTLVTEMVAIRAGAAYFGIAPALAVALAVAAIVAVLAVRRYATWERAVVVVAGANVLFVPAALLAHPSAGSLGHALLSWSPLPGGADRHFLTLLLADVGATVTPWMLFFQQGAVVDKGLAHDDLPQGRVDTALGAVLAATIAIAAVVAAAPLFAHHVAPAASWGGGDFASALRPYLGNVGSALFALGMIEAGLVAAATISVSSAYALGEVTRGRHSLNLGFSEGLAFYGSVAVSIGFAALVVLTPNAPLLALTLTVNVIATLLMAPALVLLLLLANDREIMGTLVNSRRANLFAGGTAAAIALIGAVYGVVTAFDVLGARG